MNFQHIAINKTGKTVDSKLYVNSILPHAKREGFRLFGSEKWEFQQDGATPQIAIISQTHCRNNLHAFLDKVN
jgi:hypothetical protein